MYGIHGLRLRSPVALAGFSVASEAYDVDVRWARAKPVTDHAPPGRPVASAALDGTNLYRAAHDDGAWTLRVGGVCDFVIGEGLDVIECRCDPGAEPALVAVLIAGLVVSFLLGLAGHCVLHASAVEVDGVAVALAGGSGSGKSTLAALLCGHGGRLVTDDVLRLGSRPPGIVCVGGSPQLRLRAGAAWALDGLAVRRPTSTTVDGRLAVSPTPSGDAAVPLGAIVLLGLSRVATAVDVRPVTGAASVVALTAVCRVTGWSDPEVLRAQFRALSEIAAGVRVVEAVIPWGPPSPSLLVTELRALALRPG